MKKLTLVLLALGVFSFAARSDAAQLFGATASGGPGDLYELDPATGAMIQHIGPLNDVTGLNYGVTGLAFHPLTGVLYGSTHNNSNADPATLARLVTIDIATAQVTVIGEFNAGNAGRPATMTDIAFDSAGNLYGVGSVGGPQLYTIDVGTGQATLVGASGFTSTTGGGLAIDSAGNFYGTPTASRFGSYDSVTGAYTEIVNPVVRPGGGGAYAALAFDPSGVLYGLNSAPGSPPPTYLATINPSDGAVVAVGQSVNALDAIAFRVPEPGALALVGGALAVAVAAGRRK